MDGWIKVHRKTLDNPIICKDADYFSVWMYLLLKATHKEIKAWFGSKVITLKQGQLVTGRNTIADKLNVDGNKVQRILKRFENEHQITQQTSNKNRLITIVGWDLYQAHEQQLEQQKNNKRTSSEQQINDKQTSSEQQINSKRTADEQPVNTYKNEKNERNIISISNNTRASEVFQFYQENIGVITGMIAEELDGYAELTCPEVVIYAIRQAALNNKKSCGYVKAICKSLLNEGVKTPLDLERHIQEYEQKKQDRLKTSDTKTFKKKDAEKKEYIKGDRTYTDADIFPDVF